MARVEIFRGQARRRWLDEEKRRLVAETFAPGATVHGVARRHGVSPSQLFTWRKRFRAGLGVVEPAPSTPAFAAVELTPVVGPSTRDAAVSSAAPSAPAGLIEIELAAGRVRISGAVEPATVTAALRALVGR